ncbi:hypothetical protein, partial [Bacteroides heparinolyticus]|uniref:hypothetical protein n=1 Tax=Prevotella heparinolytica TaxID=28113 RepID=UPI0035A1A1B8
LIIYGKAINQKRSGAWMQKLPKKEAFGNLLKIGILHLYKCELALVQVKACSCTTVTPHLYNRKPTLQQASAHTSEAVIPHFRNGMVWAYGCFAQRL